MLFLEFNTTAEYAEDAESSTPPKIIEIYIQNFKQFT